MFTKRLYLWKINKVKILVSVLDWGLGHASRTSEIVSRELAAGNEILLAGSGNSFELLKKDHPQLKTVELKSFSPWFFRYLPQWLAISIQVPKFLYYIHREKNDTERIVKEEHIEKIISDNRYGVRSASCESILITHQTYPIITSWAPQIINTIFAKALSKWINKFDKIWIPDIAPYPNGLSGKLSNCKYITVPTLTIGVLSRMNLTTRQAGHNHIEKLAIISGPEPQRSIFERDMTKTFSDTPGKCMIIRGIPQGLSKVQQQHNIEFVDHCDAQQLRNAIDNSTDIYCRSGYSTIMDLWALNKRASLNATKGQAEQEYLEKRMGKFGFKKN